MRIDKFLAECGDYPSRSKAREAIDRGEVLIDGVPARPSSEVSAASEIRLLTDAGGFVSAGGAKLQKALSDFGFSPRGMVFADIGASTGGFTDCLLKNGAARVYAVDVGVSQLHPRLAGDPRVTVCDRTNARYLTRDFFPEPLDGAVMDVSFISAKLLMPAVCGILEEGCPFLSLLKPQFECEERIRLKNGSVRDEKLRLKICEGIYDFAVSCGLSPQKFTTAPLREGKNTEYLMLFTKGGAIRLEKDALYCEVMKKN